MTMVARGEYHTFGAQEGGGRYLYLVPSAGVFRLDAASEAVLGAIEDRPVSIDALQAALGARFSSEDVRSTIDDLLAIRALRTAAEPVPPTPKANGNGNGNGRKRIPLTTLVLNVTSKCNLACTYCYEYGEDRIVAEGKKPRFMDEGTARQSVDFMFAESGDNRKVHLTFFGGETLLNFKVLKGALAYARERGETLGKEVDVSLTTNATLLRPEVVDWMIENNVGVTVSMDGAREQQDRHRVFASGLGSYDAILPHIQDLLQRHRGRPVGARVTLTKGNLDVTGIYRHLRDELGFWEVGFAPVTTSWQRDYAIQEEGFELMLGEFQSLALEYQETTLAGKHHGFSNVRDTIEEIHKGMSKSHPCGAGMGLLGVATDGDVALCHRFAGSDTHTLGSVQLGIDAARQASFLDAHHIDRKTDCATCWARPLCAGGCYHEAHTRYGSTTQPNLHYCEWIRRWTDTCLRVYGTLADRKPEFLAQFDA